jgi:deoxyribose-phosphate aldolase
VSETNIHQLGPGSKLGQGPGQEPGQEPDRGSGDIPARNSGIAFEADWLADTHVNRSAVERRTATLGTRRAVKKDAQAAWLLKAVTCIDLTTLAGDDTPGRVRRLCAKAKQPVRQDILDALKMSGRPIHTGAVCVYHEMVETAVAALDGTGIPVAAVSTGFPAGLSPMQTKLAEIKASVAAGAREIDIVINRGHVITGDWQTLYDEIRAFRDAVGDAHLKTILGTGDLKTLRNVAKASLVAMMAGADFIKTSTGKETVNATLPVSLVMARMIRAYRERTGFRIGFKPAGGISLAKDAITYLILMREELGREWLEPELFRFGASSLLGDIERQLEHHVTGRYSASHRHPAA